MIQGAFATEDRARAIGAWAGLGGIAAAIGPFVGGWLVEYASWRWVFLLNLPIAVLTVAISRISVPETRDPDSVPGFDIPGATVGAVALGAITFALIEVDSLTAAVVGAAAVMGVAASVAFVVVERRSRHPMMPTSLFASRQFSASNGMTLLVYAALGAITFFLVIQLQTVSGYGPLRAGVATLPVTLVLVLLASRGGQLAARIGPRIPMAVGPLVCALGIALLTGIGSDVRYWRDVFPGLLVFSLGLATLVAPLTATVLAAAPDHNAGVASGINNAVARAGSLLAVAALPAAVGLNGGDYNDPATFSAGYGSAMWICVGLLVAGGVISGILIQNPHEAGLGGPPTDGSTGDDAVSRAAS
jgi:predicted MFS family arabinose efflux permease